MLEELKNIIKGEVSSDEKELSNFSHDASIFEVKPKVIVRPEDVEDIKNLVKFVADNKSSDSDLSLTVRAGGSDMTGGPLNESIVVDISAFDKIQEIGDGYVVVEPGVFYRDLEKETLKTGQLLPSYPASRELCAVGGMVANNAGGEKSLRYGKTENYVDELNVVLGDGNEYVFKSLTKEELEQKKSQNDFEGGIYLKIHELLSTDYELILKAKPNVSKNSAGYALWNVWPDKDKFDPARLFTGSQGTLGIITKIKFKLIKPPKHSKLLVIFLRDLNGLGDLIVNLNNEHSPESIESYDDNTIKLAFKMLPALVKKMGIGSLFRFIPDAWAIITGGIPKLVILAEFTGNDEQSTKDKAQKAKHEIESKFSVKTRVAINKADVQKYRTIRRESFNLLRKHVSGKKTAPFIDDIIVRPEFLPKFLPRLKEILNKYNDKMVYTIAGHPGDGNFHIIPLMDLSDNESREIIPKLSEEVYDLVMEFKGSITAEHNDGLIRTPYLEKMYGEEICGLFKEVKEIFDPQNIFNPGKKVSSTGPGEAGSMEYAMKHIKQD